jgi:hypothetical protein
MNDAIKPSGEISNHKMVAVFESEAQAHQAEAALTQATAFAAEQLDVVDPTTRKRGRRLLPESRGIWRTWLRAHAVFGAAGGMIGMIAFLALFLADVGVVSNNPLLAGLVFLHVPTMLGLLVGGLFTLRPDQSPYLYTARDALRAGQSVLLVHARTGDELRAARQILEDPALATVRTA